MIDDAEPGVGRSKWERMLPAYRAAQENLPAVRPVIQQPTSLVEVDQIAAAVEQWAAQCDSVPELKDAANKLAAIDEYLSRTSTEGRARVAATMRRLEARIGEVLGPPQRDHDRSPGATSTTTDIGLTKDQRSDFRRMAEHPTVVEEVIAESNDEEPPSRRRVLHAIKNVKDRPPAQKVRSPLTNSAAAATQEVRRLTTRVENILADDRLGANKDRIQNMLRPELVRAVEVYQRMIDALED